MNNYYKIKKIFKGFKNKVYNDITRVNIIYERWYPILATEVQIKFNNF